MSQSRDSFHNAAASDDDDGTSLWSHGKIQDARYQHDSVGEYGSTLNASVDDLEKDESRDDDDELITSVDNGSIMKPTVVNIDIGPSTPVLIGDLACLMHLLKGMIGTGILAMPVAYRNGGLWVSLAVVMLIGVVCTHCMHVLVRCRDELCRKTTTVSCEFLLLNLFRTGDSHLEYADVMEKAFLLGGERWRKYSKAAKNSVNAFLIITQFGFCCVYNVFVAENIQQVVESVQSHKLNDRVYIVFISVLLIPYTMIKSLKIMAPFSTVANVFNCVGLVIVLYGLVLDLPDTSTRPAFAGVNTLPLFFGQAMFSFEGIGLILPLYNKMATKGAFLGKAGVVNLGLTISVCLYCAVGFYGYLKYGTDVQGSVTLNLDSGKWFFQLVKVMFAVSLFISYGVMFYVPITIIWPYIMSVTAARNIKLPSSTEYLFRIILVCIICGLAALVPHLDLLISLVGAFASSFLALVFPAVIEVLTYQTTLYTKVKDTLIITLGLLGFATGTYSSLKEIVNRF